jgi:hypothetical protein
MHDVEVARQDGTAHPKGLPVPDPSRTASTESAGCDYGDIIHRRCLIRGRPGNPAAGGRGEHHDLVTRTQLPEGEIMDLAFDPAEAGEIAVADVGDPHGPRRPVSFMSVWTR